MSLNEQPEGELDEPFAGRTAVLENPNGWLGVHVDPEVARAPSPASRACSRARLFDDGWTPDAGIILGDVALAQDEPGARLHSRRLPGRSTTCRSRATGCRRRGRAVWSKVRPVAMSRFGADEIAKIMPTRPPVIYHGVNPDAFWKVSPDRPIYVPTKRRPAEAAHARPTARSSSASTRRGSRCCAPTATCRARCTPRCFRSLAPVLAAHPNVDFIWHCAHARPGRRPVRRGEQVRPPRRASCSRTGFHDTYGGLDRAPAERALQRGRHLRVELARRASA